MLFSIGAAYLPRSVLFFCCLPRGALPFSHARHCSFTTPGFTLFTTSGFPVFVASGFAGFAARQLSVFASTKSPTVWSGFWPRQPRGHLFAWLSENYSSTGKLARAPFACCRISSASAAETPASPSTFAASDRVTLPATFCSVTSASTISTVPSMVTSP